jgi:hypothetical protein
MRLQWISVYSTTSLKCDPHSDLGRSAVAIAYLPSSLAGRTDEVKWLRGVFVAASSRRSRGSALRCGLPARARSSTAPGCRASQGRCGRQVAALRGAGGELESAQLAEHQGGSFVVVVLAGGQQLPCQADELAGDGDRRDLAAAARTHSSAECSQRPRGAHRGVRSFAEHVTCRGRALL